MSSVEDSWGVAVVKGHASMLLESMNKLRNTVTLCDVTISCEGVEHPAHRVVLASASSYFKAMFTCNMKEKDQAIIELKEIKASTLSIMLDFIYTERVYVDINNVQDLLPAACLLHLKGVEDACSEFLRDQLDPVNCLSIKLFARTHQCLTLSTHAEEYSQKHFIEVVKNEEFLELQEPDIVDLLQSSEIEVNSEEDVYETLMKWVMFKEPERSGRLPELLQYVRLPLLSARYITDVLDVQPLIKSSLRCRDLLDEAKKFHLRPELRAEMQKDKYQPRHGSSEILVVLGGFGNEQTPINTVEFYEPKLNIWKNVSSFNKKRRYLSAVAIGNRVYVIGGYDAHTRLNTVECLEFSTNDDGHWYFVAPMHRKRGLAGATVHDSQIYVAGGFDGTSRHSCAERYDPRIDKWNLLADMSCPREGAGVVSAAGCVYCIGGYEGSKILRSAEKFDPKVGTWMTVAQMGTRRSGAGVAYLNHIIYVLGGFNGKTHLSTVESYNVHTDSWSILANMTGPRCYVNACILRGKIYAVAGYDGDYILNSMEEYDPHKDSWSTVSHLNTFRCDAGVAVVKHH